MIQGRTPCGVCPGACSAWRADPSAARHHAAPGPWSTSGQTRAAGKGNCVQPVFFVPGAEGRGSPCPRPWPPQRRRRAWQAVVVARGGLGTAHGRGAAPYAALQRQYGPSLHCRVKGKLDEQSVCPYKHGLACGPWVSRSRRPATALTAGRPLDGRWTTAELWQAGQGWPQESKRQEPGEVSHGHGPFAPKTVPSPSWMLIYNVIYAECSRSWQTPHRCANPHTG